MESLNIAQEQTKQKLSELKRKQFLELIVHTKYCMYRCCRIYVQCLRLTLSFLLTDASNIRQEVQIIASLGGRAISTVTCVLYLRHPD